MPLCHGGVQVSIRKSYCTTRSPDAVCAVFGAGIREAVRGLHARVCHHIGMHHILHAVVRRQTEKQFPGVLLDDAPFDWTSYVNGQIEEPDIEMLASTRQMLRNAGK